MNYEIVKFGKNLPDNSGHISPLAYYNTLGQMVRIHKACFPFDAANDKDRERIIKAWNNPPIMRYYFANDKNVMTGFQESEKLMAGYVRWVEHGGIRPNAVIELEQIGIDPQYQGKGVATKLIDTSLLELSMELGTDNRRIKLVYVSTGNDNFAQGLYRKTLGAEVKAEIPSFYEDSDMNVNEVIMIAPRDKINETRKKRDLELV